ncbi:phage tail tube protein [uncultured Halomonas sp.]|uniref:phage tail tube protein n=1 Tax=uncultured Halomonas sp. TaxID=173971 RepID=UPI002610BB42|nr:phage tail tube protein [uncultured Halomonas sp.]
MAIVDMQGTTVTISDGGSPGTPVPIGEIYSMSGFDGEAPDNDITTFASTAQEYRPGLQDNGNVSFELFRDAADAGQQECLTARAAQATREFVITYEDGSTDTFNAYVKSLSKTGERGGQMTGTLNIRISGEVTEAAGP